jgi:signal transduction histidine kinase
MATADSLHRGSTHSEIRSRAAELFAAHQQRLNRWTDHLFAILLVVQWAAQIAAAMWISPRAWAGTSSTIHPHVWLAVLLGGIIISVPLVLVRFNPGRPSTRLAVAAAQGLSVAILIHLTGGRIETHFSVFVLLAVLAFYRDWRVLLTMAAVVALDHFVRGILWPQSVYGVNVVSPWRFLEHSGWVVLEVAFLLLLCRQGLLESWHLALQQAELEVTNRETELVNVQLRDEVQQRQLAQRQLEASKDAAEAANIAKSEFLANMSHELRTPLNAIIGFSDVLGECVFGPLNDKQGQYVTDILESGQHLLSLVNDILDLAKIESGSMEIQRVPVALARVIERSLQMFHERAVRQAIRLVGEIDPRVDVIDADERRLKQLLYNLLSNALKFTPAGGEVRVAVKQNADAVTIAVSDTGVGIAPDQHAKIFESFYQVDSTLTKIAQGTGLGLAVVRQIAELHEGSVTVESELGQGCTFVVTLPVTASQETAFTAAESENPASHIPAEA